MLGFGGEGLGHVVRKNIAYQIGGVFAGSLRRLENRQIENIIVCLTAAPMRQISVIA